MKTLKVLFALGIACFLTGQIAGYTETIYTTDGQEIKAVISEGTEDDTEMIWYEVESGDIIELMCIERSEVSKILNDDGSTSEYSPTYCKKCQNK
ncbi:MAG: hypothetical protein ABIH08_02300 [Candidatus Omnitrophota bacterium]